MKVREIADFLGADIKGNGDTEISGLSSIEKATSSDLTFLSNKKYEKFLSTTRAGCIIVDAKTDISKYNKTFIICEDAYLCFAKIVRMMFGNKKETSGISEKASIDKDANIDKSCLVDDFVVIRKGASIGKNTVLMPFVYIGENVRIGSNCIIYPNVTIRENSIIGNNVIIHSGSVIGSDGFGYAKSKDGKHIKIPQIGNVVIEDDAEIGANVTIDRAALDSTIIKRGTKIDNLVQIAHNVEIGENSVIIAQSGISGSTKIGKNVILAGQSGIAGHLKIVDNVIITAQSGVGSSIRKPGVYSGSPVYEHKKWLKSSVVTPRLWDMYKKISELEKKIEELESNDDGHK